MANKKIQDLIDKVKPGGTLKLDPPKQEYQGPIVIRKPITIDGQYSNFWSKEKGPVLSIESNGVVLDNLNIAITGKESKLSGKEACALVVKQGMGVALNNVTVKGNVLGLDAEEGDWRYPRSIQLYIKPGQPHDFKVKIIAPVPCSLKSEISGLNIQPSSLKGGEEAEVTLKTEVLPQGVRLKGDIFLKTALLSRKIAVTSRQVQIGSECTTKVTYWDTTGAKTPSSPAPSDTKTLPAEPPSTPKKPSKPRDKRAKTSGIPITPTDKDKRKTKSVPKPPDVFKQKPESKPKQRKTIRFRREEGTSLSDFWKQSSDELHKDQQKVQQVTKKSETTGEKPIDSKTTKAVSKKDKLTATKDSTTKDSAKPSSIKNRKKVISKNLSDSFSVFSPPVDKPIDKQKSKDKDDKSEEKQQPEVADKKKTKEHKPKEPKIPKKRKTLKWDGGPTAFDSDT